VSKLTNRKRKVKLTPKPAAEPSAAVVVEPKPAQQEAAAPEVKAAAPVEMVAEVLTATETKTTKPVEIKVEQPKVLAPKVIEPERVITFQTTAVKPVNLNFRIDPEVARNALAEVTDSSHIGAFVETQPTTQQTAIVTFVSTMPGYKNWKWLVMLSWLDAKHLTIDEVAMVPTDEALVAPAWVPWSQRVEAGDLGVGDELPYQALDPALAPGYVQAEQDLLDDQETLRPFWWSLGLGRERVLSATGRELAAARWSSGEYSAAAIMAKVAQGKCIGCGYFNPLAGSLGSAFGACTNAVSPADGKVVAANFGCGAHSETDAAEVFVPTVDLVYDDTYDQGLGITDDDVDVESEK
jgi:hypothetical protein